MNDIVKPTIAEIRDAWMEEDDGDRFKIVRDKVHRDDYGHRATVTYERLADGTFWQVTHVDQSNGDYNSLRDGDLSDSDVVRVWPVTKTVTDYVTTAPA